MHMVVVVVAAAVLANILLNQLKASGVTKKQKKLTYYQPAARVNKGSVVDQIQQLLQVAYQ